MRLRVLDGVDHLVRGLAGVADAGVRAPLKEAYPTACSRCVAGLSRQSESGL
jgi:hypothetical protein